MSIMAGAPSNLSERGIAWRPSLAAVSQAVSVAHIWPRRMRVRHELAASPWFKSVVRDLASAVALPPAWDSYSAAPLQLDLAVDAVVFLSQFLPPDAPAPRVVPLSDGGVQLEWHRSGLDVEITFPASDVPELYLHDHEGGAEHEALIDPPYDPRIWELLSMVRNRLNG
jgi:hypothetical protein